MVCGMRSKALRKHCMSKSFSSGERYLICYAVVLWRDLPFQKPCDYSSFSQGLQGNPSGHRCPSCIAFCVLVCLTVSHYTYKSLILRLLFPPLLSVWRHTLLSVWSKKICDLAKLVSYHPSSLLFAQEHFTLVLFLEGSPRFVKHFFLGQDFMATLMFTFLKLYFEAMWMKDSSCLLDSTYVAVLFHVLHKKKKFQ